VTFPLVTLPTNTKRDSDIPYKGDVTVVTLLAVTFVTLSRDVTHAFRQYQNGPRAIGSPLSMKRHAAL
jgi:hypothetical protein